MNTMNTLTRIKRHVSRAYYWLRTHTKDRYHMLDMRNARNGYAWGYKDRSELIMFAAFAILVEFVEKEYPGVVDWEQDDEIRAARDEFMALYTWWTKGRREENDALYRETEDVQQKADALDEKDNVMLHRLIKVRGALWT